MPLKEETRKLYDKFQQQMNGSLDDRVEYLGLMGYMADFEDPDFRDIAFEYTDNYFAVTNPDGSLDKKKFEQRIKEVEEYRTDHMYIPAVELIDEDQHAHSDYWLKDRITNDSEYAALQGGLVQAVNGQLMRLEEPIDQAYGEENLNSVLFRLQDDRRNAVVFAENADLQDKISDVIRFFGVEDALMNGKSKEYVTEQKQRRKQEAPEPSKDRQERFFSNVYKLFAGKDMSFLDDQEYHKVQAGMLGYVRGELNDPEWTPTDPADKSLYEISTGIDSLAEELRNASGYRFSDSSQFNAIKDRVKEIQEQVKKGSSLENREILTESIVKLGKECQAYLDKNAGERFTKRGNLRKDIVGRLKNLADDQQQKLLAPEMEQQMKREKEEYLKQVEAAQAGELSGSQYAKDMENLLVINGENREKAKTQVQEAIADLKEDPANIRKMEDVLTKCRQGIGRMNVRNEALKELGIAEPEKLDKAQMRAILTAPENQDKLNDFYASVSDMAGRFAMEKMPLPLQRVLRGMEADGRLKTDPDYERASAAMIKGLSGEKEWKQAREAYAAGDRSMDVTKMAALKTSLEIQRELILENGVLSGQSRVQTDSMEDLADGAVKLINTDPTNNQKKPTDHRKAAEGLTLEGVMEGNAKMPQMERAVAAAVSLRGERVQSERVEDLGKAQNMKEYEQTAHITQLDRAKTINNLVAFYMLNKGDDQNTIFDDPAARAKAAKEFKEFVASHGSELDENGKPKTEKDRKNQEEIGKFYRDSQQNMEKLRIPDIDFSDPVQRAAHQFELTSLPGMMLDLDQNMTSPSKLEPVQNVFGGKDAMINRSEELVKVQIMLQVGKRDSGVSEFDDFHGLVFGELYGNLIAGKTIGEVREAFANVSKDAVYTAGEMFFMEHFSEAEKFLSGEKKVTWDDAIKCCVEMGYKEEDYRALKDAVKALEGKQSGKQKEKEQPGAEKQEPKVEKMDLKSLMETEGKSAPSRRSAGFETEKKNPEKDRRKSMGSLGK